MRDGPLMHAERSCRYPVNFNNDLVASGPVALACERRHETVARHASNSILISAYAEYWPADMHGWSRWN